MESIALKNREATLLEVLDRVIDKGAVVDGDIYLSVADIDLICINLKLLLSSIETLGGSFSDEELGKTEEPDSYDDMDKWEPPQQDSFLNTTDGGFPMEDTECENPSSLPSSLRGKEKGEENFHMRKANVGTCNRNKKSRVDIDPKKVERGLAKLVLTLVELLRRLMEKQAVRRMEGGKLSERKIEQLGLAFMRLEERMKDLKKVFGLKDEDLNLNLGPVGNLM